MWQGYLEDFLSVVALGTDLVSAHEINQNVLMHECHAQGAQGAFAEHGVDLRQAGPRRNRAMMPQRSR